MQPVRITHPDHVAVTHDRIETLAYDTHGKLLQKAGAGGYPLTYTYDAVGNLTTLQDGNASTTRWTYTARNQVQTKTYADGTTHTYTYDLAGRLASRLDARGHTTTYTYNPAGQPTSIDYPSDTDIAFTYDQQGRRLSMTDASGSTTYTYDGLGRPASETQSRTARTLSYTYDAYSQRTALTLSGDSTPWTTRYGYDNAGRLRTVLDDRLVSGQPYLYTYAANASLVAQLTTPTGMKVNKTYDLQGRLLTTSAQSSQLTALSSYAYTYDAAGQRITEVTPERTRAFGYDQYRQLTDSSATVAGTAETFTYAYDPIGNRTSSADFQSATTYTANSVNQYVAISSQLTTENTGTLTYTSNAVNQIERIDYSLPATRYSLLSYDSNGNTLTAASASTSTSNLNLKYDEENRLIEAAGATRTLRYIYDGLGRRVERLELPTGSSTPSTATRYVYDGWRVMEEFTWTTATPTWTLSASYTRGLDLSGTPEGAGGIGGLLARSQPNGASWTTASYLYDGNGNVTHLVGDDNSIKARYTYTPFGDRLTATGEWADINTVQFSSKERDSFTGYYYYGLRHYQPNSGHWINRDPIGEEGGLSLYGFVGNAPTNFGDPLGLALYAFDGTDNDMYRDVEGSPNTSNGPTNVAILTGRYDGIKFYQPGVGTNESNEFKNTMGKAGGFGGDKRIEAMMVNVERAIEAGDMTADIIGFSRGSAMAREFANRLAKKYPCVRIRFLGLFDTVASFGVGGNDIDMGYDLSIPGSVERVLHITAADEHRLFFPLASINQGPGQGAANPNWLEVSMPGAHSDIGGGYLYDSGHGPNSRGYANAALQVMQADGVVNNVPFKYIQAQYMDTNQTIPHDSRWVIDKSQSTPITVRNHKATAAPIDTSYRSPRNIFYHP